MKKSLTIRIDVKELMYDIMNKAYITAQARQAQGLSYEATSEMQPTEDDEVVYQLRRSLVTHCASLRNLLGEYLTEERELTDNQISETINNGYSMMLALQLPGNYDSASADALGACIHAYLVDMTLADWFNITHKEDADDYVARAASSLETIQRALYKRKRPTRP